MNLNAEDVLERTGLAGAAHSVDEAWLSEVLWREYGVRGGLVRLDTEKDATFRLTAGPEQAGAAFLVKVSHPEEPREVIHRQLDVVRWIERADPEIPLQGVVDARDGSSSVDFQDRAGAFAGILRVYRFIPGGLLAHAEPDREQRMAVGAMLARVDVALSEFAQSGDGLVLAWDLSRFMTFESLIEQEVDAQHRALAHAVFTAFRDRAEPHLGAARRQFLHGDFSPYNVVVDSEASEFVTGVIDFGDTMRGPVVFDPAVLLGNHLLPAPRHPWEVARDLLDGYRGILPLTEQEVDLVAVASAARVTLRALISNWRIARGTDREAYIREHAEQDWSRVHNVIELGFDAAHAYLLHDEQSSNNQRGLTIVKE